MHVSHNEEAPGRALDDDERDGISGQSCCSGGNSQTVWKGQGLRLPETSRLGWTALNRDERVRAWKPKHIARRIEESYIGHRDAVSTGDCMNQESRCFSRVGDDRIKACVLSTGEPLQKLEMQRQDRRWPDQRWGFTASSMVTTAHGWVAGLGA